MVLARSATGESWNGIMHECFNEVGFVAIVFWISYMLVTFFMFMNIFIAVIYDSFFSIQAENGQQSDVITR